MAEQEVRVSAEVFAGMARSLEGQDGLDGTLKMIVELAVAAVPGATHAGISEVSRRRRVDTRFASDDLVVQVDAVQYDVGEGPCLDAIWEREVVRIDDLAATQRWPRFAPRAVELGVRAMLSFRLFVEDDVSGALNLYSTEAGGFTDPSVGVGQTFATHAALAWDHEKAVSRLQNAVDGRTVIGQAQGILMERDRITVEQAFDRLRRASQQRNTRLRDVADHLVRTGELLE